MVRSKVLEHTAVCLFIKFSIPGWPGQQNAQENAAQSGCRVHSALAYELCAWCRRCVLCDSINSIRGLNSLCALKVNKRLASLPFNITRDWPPSLLILITRDWPRRVHRRCSASLAAHGGAAHVGAAHVSVAPFGRAGDMRHVPSRARAKTNARRGFSRGRWLRS